MKKCLYLCTVKQKQLTIKTITIMKKTIVLAESFDPRYQSISYVHPFTGEYISLSGDLIHFQDRNNKYYHLNVKGDFESRYWYEDDITHVCVIWETYANGVFEVVVSVNF